MPLRVLTWVCAALLAGSAAFAQADRTVSPVLIIDSEQIYLGSAYGASIRAAIEDQAAALQAENDAIQSSLVAEEQDLTNRRPTMPIEDFRAEAAAFDVKVQDIRRTRDSKINQLEQDRLTARDKFREDVRDIVGALMLERGAAVILDRRTVFLALGTADITAEAIARIDAALMPPDGQIPAPDAPTASPDPVLP